MTYSLGPSLILLGLAMIAFAQMGMAGSAMRGNLLRGMVCVLVPMHPAPHAKNGALGTCLVTTWYLGIATLVMGGIIAS